MDAPEVLAVLDLLAAAGADVWVDGGWGVDALLAITTRRHSDLDLVVRLPELATVRQALREAGYDRVLRDWSPVAVALVDRRGHEIDLHLIRPTADGGGDRADQRAQCTGRPGGPGAGPRGWVGSVRPPTTARSDVG
jgi:lincosamide nucleotidyltransferase A/C/D/E